ncbi:hypothetical protein DPEC_G00153520 [Dallia pectoralis]|uniref:Uncharacterized protein n=1 Tax=Dallia pectoralis TaxID=75939 RepID=A0ACC2GK60_DALPE|nr:hypothetical protein DPEC_G00153520 [Dallia pectoralis]
MQFGLRISQRHHHHYLLPELTSGQQQTNPPPTIQIPPTITTAGVRPHFRSMVCHVWGPRFTRSHGGKHRLRSPGPACLWRPGDQWAPNLDSRARLAICARRRVPARMLPRSHAREREEHSYGSPLTPRTVKTETGIS